MRTYLVGAFSLADIMVATMVQYLSLTPEGARLFGDHGRQEQDQTKDEQSAGNDRLDVRKE